MYSDLIHVMCYNILYVCIYVEAEIPLINSISRNINSRLPNNMAGYVKFTSTQDYLHSPNFCSKTPVGVTVSSQISLNGSRVQLPDNTQVTLFINISSMPVSC